jgi:hypothetical protein
MARGHVYLKVFNKNTGERLSEDRLFIKSNERIGFSTNTKENFFYNSNITIYEGDWSHFYEARFELWFVPDGGGKEKKIVETTRKICGWQR